jgi:hypothetical protein
MFLATAVCGMHYLGLGGTSYYVKPGTNPEVLSSAGDQATRLTIGKLLHASREVELTRSHLHHVWSHCRSGSRLHLI